MNRPDDIPQPPPPRINLSPVLKRRQRRGTGWLSPAEVRALHDGRAWLQAELLRAEPLARQALNALAPHWDVPQPPTQPEMSVLDTLTQIRRSTGPGSNLIRNAMQFSWIRHEHAARRISPRALTWALLTLHFERRLQLISRLERADQVREMDAEFRFGDSIQELFYHRGHRWLRRMDIRSPWREIMGALLKDKGVSLSGTLSRHPAFAAQRSLTQLAELLVKYNDYFGIRWLVYHAGTLTDQAPPGGRWTVRRRRTGALAWNHDPRPRPPGRQTRAWLLEALRVSGLTGDEFRQPCVCSGTITADLLNFIRAGGLSALSVPESESRRSDAANWAPHLIVLLGLPEPFRAYALDKAVKERNADDLTGMLNLARLARGPELPHLHAALNAVTTELERAREQREQIAPQRLAS